MIKVSSLMQKIDCYRPKVLQDIDNEESILTVRQISDTPQKFLCFCSHTLYVCSSSNLSDEFRANGRFFLLCILDSPIPDQYRNDPNAFLITLEENSCSVEELLNKVYALFDDSRDRNESETTIRDILKNYSIYTDLKKLMDMLQNYLKNPVVYLDALYNVISYSSGCDFYSSSYSSLNSLIKNKFPELEDVKKIENRISFQEKEEHKPQIYDASPSIPYRQIVGPIFVGNTLVAYLTIHEINTVFQKEDFEIVEYMCYFFSLERQKDESNPYHRGGISPYEYIIRSILNGDTNTANIFHSLTTSKILNYNIKDYFYIMSLYSINPEKIPYSPEFICERVQQTLANSISIVFNKQVVTIITTDTEFSKECYDQINNLASKYNLVGGISSIFTSLDESSKHYEESVSALNIALDMNDLPPIVYYDDIFPYLIIQTASKYDKNIATYVNPHLQKLLEYDEKHKTDFVHTLFIYLIQDRNVAASIRIAHVHRNTFLYRIQKIEEIMGISLEKETFRFQLLLSYYLLSFRYKEPSY